MTRSLAWMDHAACRGADLTLFFPTDDTPQNTAALEYCRACPVRAQCAAYAEEREEGASRDRRAGVWGGHTVAERVRLARQTGHTGLVASRRAKILRLHEAGLDTQTIAEQVGCHERTVMRVTAQVRVQRQETAA